MGEDSKDKQVVINILNLTLKGIVKVLHPFMPYITTVIYDSLIKSEDDSFKENDELMLSDFPIHIDNMEYIKEETAVENIQELISSIRNIRTENKVENSRKTKLYIDNLSLDSYTKIAILELKTSIVKMASLSDIEFKDKIEVNEDLISIILPGISAYILRGDLIDIEEEIKRLEKEKEEIEKKLEFTNNLLTNKGFIDKAPEEKIKKEKENKEEYIKILDEVNLSLQKLIK